MSQIKIILTVAVILAFLVAAGCQSNQFQQKTFTNQKILYEPWSLEGFLAAPISLIVDAPDNPLDEFPHWCISRKEMSNED